MQADPADHFADDYASARSAFLAAAEARGAELGGDAIEARGPGGDELCVDRAYLGPGAPERLLVLSSGIHGAEGFAGSAIQHHLLQEQHAGLALPRDAGLLLIHAINPWGFAHLRRVNESNVDLNRNFLRHPEDHVANEDYDALYDAINPASLDADGENERRTTLGRFAAEHGFPRLQAALTCGQYRHPTGVQFGGARQEASNHVLRRVAAEELRGARQVCWIDLHTGLGPWGEYEMIVELETDDPEFARARAWFGSPVRSTLAGESVSPPLHGTIEAGLHEAAPDGVELTAVAAEFGTYEPQRVFQAMRADNWLEHHGDAGSEEGRAIKAELLEVFRPEAPDWKARVLEGSARFVEQACAGLAGS